MKIIITLLFLANIWAIPSDCWAMLEDDNQRGESTASFTARRQEVYEKDIPVSLVAATLPTRTTIISSDEKETLLKRARGGHLESLARLNQLAETEEVWAQCALGEIYAGGHGVDKDIFRAAAWYQKAARYGVRDAQIALQAINNEISEEK